MVRKKNYKWRFFCLWIWWYFGQSSSANWMEIAPAKQQGKWSLQAMTNDQPPIPKDPNVFLFKHTSLYKVDTYLNGTKHLCVFYSSWLHRPSEDKIHSRHHQTPGPGKEKDPPKWTMGKRALREFAKTHCWNVCVWMIAEFQNLWANLDHVLVIKCHQTSLHFWNICNM